MTERPILFSGPMVRAILDGRKTQTRRLVKPQPDIGDGGCWFPKPPRKPAHRARHYANEAHLRKGLAQDFCPYGAPGDRLWVRENFALVYWGTDDSGRIDDVTERRGPLPKERPELDSLVYEATAGEPKNSDDRGYRWRPSIYMPRWASRVTLEVTGVRVERVQDISDADIAAEGVTAEAVRALWDAATKRERFTAINAVIGSAGNPFSEEEGHDAIATHADDPRVLWEFAWTLINGRASWDANPWVWVVEFRPVDAASAPMSDPPGTIPASPSR